LGIASLVDAFHVPKLLSQQLLPLGRSGDVLGVLTFGVEQFSVLFVPGGRSARAWRTVRAHSVLVVFFVFLLGFAFDPFWFGALVGSGFGQSAAAGKRSAGAWRTVRVLPADGPLFGVVSGGSVCFFGRSAVQGRTVRGLGADSPRQRAGRSAWPVRTVCPSWPDGPPEPECFILWFNSLLFLSCFCVFFKESFLRLEVDP
jgi:hypothetical protein